jgi:hypothetical protein
MYVSGSEIIYWTKVKHYPVSNGFCNAITMFKHSSEEQLVTNIKVRHVMFKTPIVENSGVFMGKSFAFCQ